jgi:hypothetical protein
MSSFFSYPNMDHYIAISITITFIGVAIGLFNNYNGFNNVTRVRQVDTTRVHEGLPTDVSLTPEDFINDPELAEIFDVTDNNTNLDIALESNEHYEFIENQNAEAEAAAEAAAAAAAEAGFDYDNLSRLYDIIEAFLSSFN